jgi:hypothetical protein
MIDDRTDQPERGNTERRSTSPRALAAPGAVLHRPRDYPSRGPEGGFPLGVRHLCHSTAFQ